MRARTRPKRRRKPRLLVFLLLFAAVIAGGAYVLSLPIWQIRDVVVNGAQMLSAEEIRTLAAVPLSENLFFTSFSRTRGNLNKIAAIKSFRIYRIPPGTVLINITERNPIAALVFPHSSAIIDREGYILNREQSISLKVPNIADLPIIAGISERSVMKGERIDAKTAQIISDIILKLSHFLQSRRMQLDLGGLEQVSFLLDDLLRVKVGEAEEINRKMMVFEALLPEIAGKWSRVEYVDVRFPDNPVIKYR